MRRNMQRSWKSVFSFNDLQKICTAYFLKNHEEISQKTRCVTLYRLNRHTTRANASRDERKRKKSAFLDSEEMRMLFIGHGEQGVLHESAIRWEITKRNGVVREHFEDVPRCGFAHQLFKQDQRLGATKASAIKFLYGHDGINPRNTCNLKPHGGYGLRGWKIWRKILFYLPNAGIAQLVELLFCKQEVAGSSPAASTILFFRAFCKRYLDRSSKAFLFRIVKSTPANCIFRHDRRYKPRLP